MEIPIVRKWITKNFKERNGYEVVGDVDRGNFYIDDSDIRSCDLCEKEKRPVFVYEPDDPYYTTFICIDCLKRIVEEIESVG